MNTSQAKKGECVKGILAVTFNLYLEHDVDEEEKRNIIRNMDYYFDHELISQAVVLNWE